MGVLDVIRSRPVMCWKQYCGFSTQVRNGTCCRKAIRTTKLYIDAFKLCCNEILRLVLTDVANELRENGALDSDFHRAAGSRIGSFSKILTDPAYRKVVTFCSTAYWGAPL